MVDSTGNQEFGASFVVQCTPILIGLFFVKVGRIPITSTNLQLFLDPKRSIAPNDNFLFISNDSLKGFFFEVSAHADQKQGIVLEGPSKQNEETLTKSERTTKRC